MLNKKRSLAAVAATLIVLAAGTACGTDDSTNGSSSSSSSKPTAPSTPDSTAQAPAGVVGRVLGEPGTTSVVLTEFMDFECPACKAFAPLIGSMQEKFAGQVTFEVRYLPLEMHPNAFPAAYAAEAMGLQGHFNDAYKWLFATQSTWSGEEMSEDEAAAYFRDHAEALGLDMDTYDTDVDSQAVKDRIAADVKAAEDKGVQGTPSFFLGGKAFEVDSAEAFEQGIADAVGAAQ